jgi:hypothetical protein
MPKKTVSKTETEIVATAPVVVVDAAAPVVAAEKKSRKPKAVKTEAVVAETPVTTTTATATASDATVAADAETPLAEQSVEFLAKLQQLGTLINSIKSEYKALEKKWSREVKTAQKQSSKR